VSRLHSLLSCLLASFLTVSVSGCASIHSTRLPMDGSKTQGGMVYYLPKQRLKLTLTVAQGAQGTQPTRSIMVAVTDPFADRSARYVAQYRRNQIGSNTLKVKINSNGLLDGDTEGSSTPQVAEFLGRLAGIDARQARFKQRDKEGCKDPGTYEWILDGIDDKVSLALHRDGRVADVVMSSNEPDPSWCGLIVRVDELVRQVPQQSWSGVDLHGNGHGFFYRQKRPVQVTVSTDGGERKVFVHTLVDERSPTEYLPIPRTLFAATTWKVTFSNGTPTFYDVNAGGDVLGLAKLPADVLKAYSQAVTAGLTDRKNMAATETEYLKQLAALAAQQAKYEACRAAAQGDDPGKIQDACK
jgi:hypothetical protein